VHTCNLQLERSISCIVRFSICHFVVFACISISSFSTSCTARERFILSFILNMGIISSVLGAISEFLFGPEDRPQQPPPQERPPQQPPRPYRPHRPQAERPPQSYPSSTSPPKQNQEYKPHTPRPSKNQHPVCPCLQLPSDLELTAHANPDAYFIILIPHGMRYYRRYR